MLRSQPRGRRFFCGQLTCAGECAGQLALHPREWNRRRASKQTSSSTVEQESWKGFLQTSCAGKKLFFFVAPEGGLGENRLLGAAFVKAVLCALFDHSSATVPLFTTILKKV